MTKSGTGTWDLGRGDSGTRGLGDSGTRGRGDSGTWGRGDSGTWGRGDSETWERGDSGTWGRGDPSQSSNVKQSRRPNGPFLTLQLKFHVAAFVVVVVAQKLEPYDSFSVTEV